MHEQIADGLDVPVMDDAHEWLFSLALEAGKKDLSALVDVEICDTGAEFASCDEPTSSPPQVSSTAQNLDVLCENARKHLVGLGQYIDHLLAKLDAAVPSTTPRRHHPGVPVVDPSRDWQSVPTSDIGLEFVTGLGPKTYRYILDACPTLKDLDAMRQNRKLQDIPGVGRSLEKKIEDRQIEYLTAHASATAGHP